MRHLKWRCHGDFAVVWSKLLKYLTKNLFCKMKLFLQHREENIKVFLLGRTNHNQSLVTSLNYTCSKNLKKIGSFFQVAIHFHPGHPQPNIIKSSFCALVALLLTKLCHYFNDSIETKLIRLAIIS